MSNSKFCSICGYHPGSSVCSAMHATPEVRCAAPVTPVSDEAVKAALSAHGKYWNRAKEKIEAQGIVMNGEKMARIEHAAMRAVLESYEAARGAGDRSDAEWYRSRLVAVPEILLRFFSRADLSAWEKWRDETFDKDGNPTPRPTKLGRK